MESFLIVLKPLNYNFRLIFYMDIKYSKLFKIIVKLSNKLSAILYKIFMKLLPVVIIYYYFKTKDILNKKFSIN